MSCCNEGSEGKTSLPFFDIYYKKLYGERDS